MKLLNPYGKTINFPIQEVTDNYIVLLINGELIDEDTEVGDYTIQIRLYDKDKNSKLTLPAIANCIHIQQPIFSEVEENTVDTAAIDTASVMESDEGELPVVDSTGKYLPTVWDTGDTISKAKINHIEKGILKAHTDALAAQADNIQTIEVTPQTGDFTSDIITLFNSLPQSGLVFITNPDYYNISRTIGLKGLCYVNTYTGGMDNTYYSEISCYHNGIFALITSTGELKTTSNLNPDLTKLMPVLESSNRKKGQVLTMTSNSEYGWADTTPELCIHNITGNAEVQLTLDPYQLINISDATPQDLSSKYTVEILTPNIEESDNHVYKIHVIFMGYSNVDYIMPSGVYNYPTDDFTAEMVYEFIFTYVKPKWLVNGSEYSIKHSNAPQ